MTNQQINNSTPHRYFILNKPRNMVSQFISPDKVGLLGDVPFIFPEGTHAIGRLDNDSEGLLILTTNKKITRLMFQANNRHRRTYLVLVQNVVSTQSLNRLREGVSIPVKKGVSYIARPEAVEIVLDPQEVYSNATDVRCNYPHTWLLISLQEGKFRQVRKMVMAIKHRCLRL
ncbi:MAG: pseudouridine synthase, partial [Ferruginibacter sp.]